MKVNNLLTFLIVASLIPIHARGYTVQIQAQSYFPLAWSFKDSTVANAFPYPDEGTRLYFWKPQIQSWYIVEFDLGEWSDPQFPITNGSGFYYYNPNPYDIFLTVTGEVLTESTKSFNYTSGKLYLIGYAFLQPESGLNCVECILRPNGPPYMDYSLGSTNTWMPGDVIYWWHDLGKTWVYAIRKTSEENCSKCSGGNAYWESAQGCAWSPSCYLSPQIPRGHAFWFKPSSNRTWQHRKNFYICP